MRVEAALADDDGGAEGAQALHATLDMRARASGHAVVPECARRTSAAADSAPASACSAADVLMRPACTSHRMRGDRQGAGRWLMSAMNGSALNPKRSRARATAARQTASEVSSGDDAAEAASGGQGLAAKEGAAQEGGTCARRRTSAASLCMSWDAEFQGMCSNGRRKEPVEKRLWWERCRAARRRRRRENSLDAYVQIPGISQLKPGCV